MVVKTGERILTVLLGMESWPATMTKASRARATPLFGALPEEIVLCEILVRLPPKSLIRCNAVCRAWHCATSTHPFLQAHHRRQPCLPIVSAYRGIRYDYLLAFDHRAADVQLQPVVRLENFFYPEASCDGLLVLSNNGGTGTCFSVCNPATRQHILLPQLSGFTLLEMYQHRSTGEYRLLLQQILIDQIGCYVFALGSNKPPRYIGQLEAAPSAYLHKPFLVRDNLHWYPVHYHGDPHLDHTGSRVLLVFDTTSESFREMRAPAVLAKSYIFEMDGTLGIYSNNDDMEIVDIWVLCDYGSKVWRYMYRVKMPVTEMKELFGGWLKDNWCFNVYLVDGDVLLLINHGGWMFHVNTDGKLVNSFRRDGQHVYSNQLRLKQTLVRHTFFRALEGYDVNASPFV